MSSLSTELLVALAAAFVSVALLAGCAGVRRHVAANGHASTPR